MKFDTFRIYWVRLIKDLWKECIPWVGKMGNPFFFANEPINFSLFNRILLKKKWILFDLKDKFWEHVLVTSDNFNLRHFYINKAGKLVKEKVCGCFIVHFNYKRSYICLNKQDSISSMTWDLDWLDWPYDYWIGYIFVQVCHLENRPGLMSNWSSLGWYRMSFWSGVLLYLNNSFFL